MPGSLKALIVILPITILMLFFLKKKIPAFITPQEFSRFNTFVLGTFIIGFISNNYWLFWFIFIAFIKLQLPSQSERKLTIYLLLLPLMPMLQKTIPGFAGINYLIDLTYPRGLALIILLPLFLHRNEKSGRFFKRPGDTFFAAYFFLTLILNYRDGSITNILRSELYTFLDIFLPYYVTSRYLKSFRDFQLAAYALVITSCLISGLAILETLKGWDFFASLNSSLGISQLFSSYSFRDGVLRASGPFSSPIVLGYVISIGLGMAIAISSFIKDSRLMIFGLMGMALIMTLSRGPWVGLCVILLVYTLTSRNKRILLPRALKILVVLIPVVMISPYGDKIINSLPFIGHANTGSVDYREKLFDQASKVIAQRPILGSNTYMQTPEMQSLVQGQGIVDVVNSYLRIALDSGILGLSFFVLFFLGLIIKLRQQLRKLDREADEDHQFGTALIATLIGALLVIATVSSIDIVSQLYWVLGGMCSAYISYLKTKNASLKRYEMDSRYHLSS